MKLDDWMHSFLLSLSFILLQTTEKAEEADIYREEWDELGYYPNPTIQERIVLVPWYFSKSVNNGVGFVRSFSILFVKIFVDNEITSLHNLSVLSDIYNYGMLLEEEVMEMIYCMIGYPIEEEYDIDGTIDTFVGREGYY